jgi:inner membrane protein
LFCRSPIADRRSPIADPRPVDNLTHSLVGLALSEVALRDTAARPERRLFLAVGLIASNAPDFDLLYTGATPAPLGYLLHHRGHTHTIPGLIVLGLLITFACWLVPTVRRLSDGHRVRLLLLIYASVFVHLLLDAFNSYGIHPFYPLDARWYYGDAIFIFEPWVWLLLGVVAAWNLESRIARFAIATVLTLLPITLVVLGIVSARALATLAVAGVALAWAVRHMSRRTRAIAALAATALAFAGMFGLSRMAGVAARSALEPERRGELVDVILTPNPASVLCWAMIAVQKDEPAGEFVLRRGTLSLNPAWQPPTGCASFRFVRAHQPPRTVAERVAWSDEVREPLQRLRDLGQRDCWVRAWLQFGRAPVIRNGKIFDLRFDSGSGEDFTAMTLRPDHDAATCPPHVTDWAMPRADLLVPSR